MSTCQVKVTGVSCLPGTFPALTLEVPHFGKTSQARASWEGWSPSFFSVVSGQRWPGEGPKDKTGARESPQMPALGYSIETIQKCAGHVPSPALGAPQVLGRVTPIPTHSACSLPPALPRTEPPPHPTTAAIFTSMFLLKIKKA